MITEAVIQEVINKLVKTYDPLEIYLFGSYAWGHPTKDSDLDILVIVEHSNESSYQRMLAGHRALINMGISKHILVQTREEFERKSDDITTLYYQIKREGKKVYDSGCGLHVNLKLFTWLLMFLGWKGGW